MTKKLLALLFVFIIIITSLVACDNGEGGEETMPSVDTEDSLQIPEETQPEPSDLSLTVDGELICRVVRSNKLSDKHYQVEAAKNICRALQKLVGKNPVRLYDDWIKAGEHDPNSVEIIVGTTNYPESMSVLDSISYGEYAIRVVGKKLVVAAHTEEAIKAASEKLVDYIATNAKNGTLTIPADLLLTDVVDETVSAIPSVCGGTYNTTYICGNGKELIIADSDVNEFNNYLSVLESAGYERITATSIAENQFATYENSKLTLNVGYYNYEDSIRIVVEDKVEKHPFVEAKEYTAVTTSSVTMIGCGYTDSDGDVISNGLSMVIRLEDGSFVIVDGGHKNTDARDGLLLTLKKLSEDYRKAGEKIKIALWIITHPHIDHYGVFNNYSADVAKECDIETVIYNVADMSEIEKGVAEYPDNDLGGGDRGANIVRAAKGIGVYLHTARVGETYHLAGAKLEILFTMDAFGPKIINAVNTQSIVSKMTFKDGTTLMITGDATGNGLETCAKMYGAYLRSDMLQLAHHGGSTWGNNNGVIMAYNFVKPTLLLWPTTEVNYAKACVREYNIILYSKNSTPSGTNDNFKEYIVSGDVYEATTVPIPYVVGNSYKLNIK